MHTRILALAILTFLFSVPALGDSGCRALDADQCAFARQQLEEALDIAKGTEDWDGHNFLVGKIANAYARLGDIGKAIELAKLADKAINLANLADGIPPTEYHLGGLVDVLVKAGRSSDALVVIASMDGKYYQENALLKIRPADLSLEERGVRLDRLRALAIADGGCCSYSSVRLVLALAEAGDMGAALSLSEKIDDPSSLIRARSELAPHIAREKNVREALRMLESALMKVGEVEWKNDQVLALANIAAGYAQIDLTKKAYEIFDRAHRVAIGEEEVIPVSFSYSKKPFPILLLLALSKARAGYVEGAIRSAAALHSGSGFKQIAEIWVREGNTRAARTAMGVLANVTDRVRKKSDRNILLEDMAEIQILLGDFGDARATILRISKRKRRDMRLWDLARAQTDAGQFESAHETTLLVEDPVWRRACVSRIAVTHAELGNLIAAYETLAAIQKPYPWHTLHGFAEAHTKAGEIDVAMETIKQAAEVNRHEVWRSFPKILAKHGHPQVASEWVRTFEGGNYKVWGLVGIVEGMVARGSVRNADAVIANPN